MSNLLEKLIKDLPKDIFTVIQLSVQAVPDGLTITCAGSKAAVEAFKEKFGVEDYNQIKSVMETAGRRVNEIICSSECCDASVDVLELKKQAGGTTHAC